MPSSQEIVRQFWAAMQRNDFRAAGELLDDAYTLEWPQSGECVRGRANFVAVNEQYPAVGRWHFTINQLLADGDTVVTDVSVRDEGRTSARAITFSTVRAGRIVDQVEFWPDPFEPAEWRAGWVERM